MSGNPSGDYNPCDYELAAKFWECLRRNAEFGEAFRWLRTPDSKRQGGPPLRVDHLLVSELASNLTCDVTIAERDESRWPDLPDKIKRMLRELLNKRSKCIPIHQSDGQRDDNWRLRIKKLAESHTVVAIPQFAFDKTHAKQLTANLAQLVAVLNPNEQLRKDGAAFGAPKQWRYFLLVEELSSQVPISMACHLVAHAVGRPSIFARVRDDPAKYAEGWEGSTRKTESDYILQCVRAITRHRDGIWRSVASLMG